MNYLILILYSFAYALTNVVGAGLIKSEINNNISLNNFSDFINLFYKPKVLIGLSIVFGSALILFKALSVYDFSKIIPLSVGINFVLTSIIGVFIFNEIINTYSIVGMSIIIIGVIILTFS